MPRDNTSNIKTQQDVSDNTRDVIRKLLPDVKIDWLRINNYGIHGKRI